MRAAIFVAPAEPDKFGVAESGFGPLPLARRWVISTTARLAREHRSRRAEFIEWSFAV